MGNMSGRYNWYGTNSPDDIEPSVKKRKDVEKSGYIIVPPPPSKKKKKIKTVDFYKDPCQSPRK